MPILFNKDDPFDFDKPANNMLAAIGDGILTLDLNRAHTEKRQWTQKLKTLAAEPVVSRRVIDQTPVFGQLRGHPGAGSI
jgi:hypothetical protein